MPSEITNQRISHDASAEILRERLKSRVRDITQSNLNVESLIPGLHLSYIERPQCVDNCFYVLSVGLILQGSKRLIIGNKTYTYGSGAMIVTSVDMPTSYELLDVKPSSPFISLSYRLNPATLSEFLSDEETLTIDSHEVFNLGTPTLELLEDFERLLRLLDHPDQLRIRAPMLIRDIHYLALTGTSGECLRALYAPGAIGQRLRKAIRWLRDNFREPITIEQLSSVANMAPTTFHRHFKAFTSFSPLQYQKRLRLYEAQQFLLRGDGDVNSAAYAVGYQSPQQFNRDYKTLFGTTPGKSIKAQRGAIYTAVGDDNFSPHSEHSTVHR